MIISGGLALAGLRGVVTGDMQLRNMAGESTVSIRLSADLAGFCSGRDGDDPGQDNLGL